MTQGRADDETYFTHWADHAAAKTLKEHPDAALYTCAAGITPSGVVHVGNFREVITVDLVARALRDRGVAVRFIYSWDDFDVFRKVPEGMPDREGLKEGLRRSIVDVADPYGCHASYADHHIAAFEGSIGPLGIAPEFIRQSQRYRAGAYAEGIRRALAARAEIVAILNRAREATSARTMIDDAWLPLAGFCGACGRDELDFTVDTSGGEGHERVAVHCRLCGHDGVVDLAAGGDLKLPWRIDWPMRWAYEGVCFEPGGKDHSTAGGSFDTAKHIVAAVYGGVAPSYIGYDFVRIKGRAGKISSSSGDVVTVGDCLEIYEPALLRYIFASTRPNTEFQISFDLDVIKIYEEYDRARRLAHEADDGSKADQKRQVARRTLQLASVDHRRITPGSPLPAVPGFRHLTTILQVYGGDLERTLAHYVASGEITSDEERAHTRVRARCAWNWLVSFAPDDFRYELREASIVRELSGDEAVALGRLVAVLEASPSLSEDELVPHMRGLCDGTAIDNKSFLPVVYDLLLGREKGPKVTTLITTMGIARAIELLRPSVAARAG